MRMLSLKSPEVDVKQAYINMGQGVRVEADVYNIARRIEEYDPNLHVQFLTDVQRIDEPPFRIVERCKDGIDRPLFGVWILDETVLQRIFAADTQKFDVLKRLDENNAKAKQVEKQRYRDSMEHASEIVQAVIKSPKDTFTVPQRILSEGTSAEAGVSSTKTVKFTN